MKTELIPLGLQYYPTSRKEGFAPMRVAIGWPFGKAFLAALARRFIFRNVHQSLNLCLSGSLQITIILVLLQVQRYLIPPSKIDIP